MNIISSQQVNNQKKTDYLEIQWTLEAQMSYRIKQNIGQLEESLLK